MKFIYVVIIVLILFLVVALFIPVSAALPLSASLSSAFAGITPIQSISPTGLQAGVQLQQAAPTGLIGCPIVPVTGIFADPQSGGQPQDYLVQGTCVQFDQRSEDGQWIRIQSGENLVSRPGWVSAVDVLLEGAVDQLPAAVRTISAGSAGPSTAAASGGSAAIPTGGVSACLESVNSLNVRSGPGIAYRSVGYLLKGSCVTLAARTAGAAWVKSDQGWMAVHYLQVQGNLSQLPVP